MIEFPLFLQGITFQNLESCDLFARNRLNDWISLFHCRSVLFLLKNPTFIFLCLAGATEATLIAGMSTFGPKFLESQFSLSASEAATWFGKYHMSIKLKATPFCSNYF